MIKEDNHALPARQPAAKCVQMTSAANAIQATIYMKIWSAWMLATPKQGTIYKVFQSVLTFDATSALKKIVHCAQRPFAKDAFQATISILTRAAALRVVFLTDIMNWLFQIFIIVSSATRTIAKDAQIIDVRCVDHQTTCSLIIPATCVLRSKAIMFLE